MSLKTYLDILAQQFPNSQWNVLGGDVFEAATLDIEPLQLKVCMFPNGFKHFPVGAVTLSLHAGSSLVKMYGESTLTAEGRVTRCSMNAEQFSRAAFSACSDLLGLAAAIETITDGQTGLATR